MKAGGLLAWRNSVLAGHQMKRRCSANGVKEIVGV